MGKELVPATEIVCIMKSSQLMENLFFKKYSSVENTFDDEYMEKVRREVPQDTVFVVQEKVHGSNVSFVCALPDGEMHFGKRTSFVEEDEHFFNWKEFVPKYENRIRKVCSLVKEYVPEAVSCNIFGEMFGGSYPHPDVKRCPGLPSIQKGVFYCPSHEFYGFDIFCVTPSSAYYLPVDTVGKIFSLAGILYAETLFEGGLDDCLHYSNAFPSTIPSKLGLPPLEDNICEGIVIRPKVPINLSSGARVIIKSKNARFAEKKAHRDKVPQKSVEYTEELSLLLSNVADYITEPRIGNVTSKVGQMVFPREFGKMLGLYSKDVIEDFLKGYGTDYYELSKAEQKLFNKKVNSLCSAFLKDKLLTDGLH